MAVVVALDAVVDALVAVLVVRPAVREALTPVFGATDDKTFVVVPTREIVRPAVLANRAVADPTARPAVKPALATAMPPFANADNILLIESLKILLEMFSPSQEKDDRFSEVSSLTASQSGSEDSPNDINPISAVVETMRVPFSSIIVSKRNSGKSFLVRDLVYNLSKLKKINQLIVMSNTSGMSLNQDYNFVDKRFLTTFSQEKIEKLMKIQAKAIQQGNIREILLVLDDVIGGDGTKKAEGNRLIRSLYANGRHYHISIVLLSQIANRLLEPPLRENSDYIFFSRLGQRGLETLWESIPVIPKKDFIQFASTHNKDFTFVLYDNMTQSNNPEDFLFLVKADERKFLLNQKPMEKKK